MQPISTLLRQRANRPIWSARPNKNLRLALFALAIMMGFAACKIPIGDVFSAAPASDLLLLIDTTAPGITETLAHRVLRAETGDAITAGKNVSVWVVDSHAGARKVAPFTPTKPVSQAKKYLMVWKEEQLRAAEQLFGAVLPGIFAAPPPKSSPLATAILTATAGRMGPVELHILSDFREVSSVWNFERGRLPTADEWTARLAKLGYTKTSLQGVRVHVVGMPLIHPSDQETSPKKGLEIQELWRSALTSFGAASVTFGDDRQASLWHFFIPSPLLLWWRKRRAYRMGRTDGEESFPYDPKTAVEEIIGREPTPEEDDPELALATETVHKKKELIETGEARASELRTLLARQPNPWVRIIGAGLMIPVDVLMSAGLARDLGAQSPEHYFAGGTVAAGLIIIAYFAGKGTKVDGKKPVWFYVVLSSAFVVIVSLTIVRATNAPPTGDLLFVMIAAGIFQAIGVVGPAAIFEVLIEQIRPVMPNWNELRVKLKEVRGAKKLLDKAVRFLAAETKRRKIWKDWSSPLTAAFKRGYITAGGEIPPKTDPPPASKSGPEGTGGPGGSGNTSGSSRPGGPVNGGLPEWPQ